MDRFFDIFFSGIALLILSPLLVPVSITLRLTGEERYSFYKSESARAVKILSCLSLRLC